MEINYESLKSDTLYIRTAFYHSLELRVLLRNHNYKQNYFNLMYSIKILIKHAES